IILDGWGLCENTKGNLIACAETPVMDGLMKNYPSSRLAASGVAVGLPPQTVGNSEAGHLHMGAGRRIYSDRLKIDQSITDFKEAMQESVIDKFVNDSIMKRYQWIGILYSSLLAISASGQIVNDVLYLDLVNGEELMLYRCALTISKDALSGSFNAFDAYGRAWSGTIQGNRWA
ncbi:MAG: hypothetical protein HGA93_01935, partial [Methanothrix sp.]|nr:hypothetical protein [Methanothrix sp.]